jgi:alkaline phosphatase D
MVDLQRDRMQVQMRAVSDAHDPQATIETLKSYVVESGRPGVVEA